MPEQTTFPTPTILSVNGVELEVFEAGHENKGRPIVLCHGWPDHALTWRHQVPALVAAGYHVIAPNQRGYGNSSCPSEVTDYDIEHLCGDLVALGVSAADVPRLLAGFDATGVGATEPGLGELSATRSATLACAGGVGGWLRGSVSSAGAAVVLRSLPP